MTTRPRVAVVLGVAGLGVAVAQALLLGSPPTWFQLAVVAFWGVVGTAYLASGLGQRLRDRLRPRRPRVPDGELSTGGPGEDADVVRRNDVRDERPGTRETPVATGAGGDDLDPGEPTVVVPPLAATPVRPARARTAPPARHEPVAAGRPAPPSLSPASAGPVGSGAVPGPGRAVLPGHPLPASAATPGPVAPPTAAETTAPRVSPWPHAASPVPSAPAVPATPPALPATAAIPTPEVVPAPPAPPAPEPEPVEGTTVDPGPGTSPSFAIRHADALSFGRSLPAPRTHASGRHAVPDEPAADETAPRRSRHRRPTDTHEQPAVPAMAGAAAPTRRHRRRAG